MLTEMVESYLAVRRACGFGLKSEGNLLRSFAIYSDARGHHRVCSNLGLIFVKTQIDANAQRT